MNRGLLPETIERKFWERVNKNAPGDCWLWTGAKTGQGYGIVKYGGVRTKVHRKAFEMFKGKITKGMVIDHLCENKACVNPDHLDMVTQLQNTLRYFNLTGTKYCEECRNKIRDIRKYCEETHPKDKPSPN